MKRAVVLPIALLLVVSCSKLNSPTEPAGTGRLIITVLDNTSHTGIANVTIEIRHVQNGPVVTTAKTDNSGVANVVLPAGTYWVGVVRPAGYGFAQGQIDTGSQLRIDIGAEVAMTVGLSPV